ncbi:uncharacterized protein LOC127839907 [Dreissena polymorpha]|uniref:uncharacterized protein LOC127839907 n=1 Tax=Dreissena polymorpha TaxID=45954 RepID=UPI002264FDC9|nr:uncharacterized protein LOC127839907 [Dreissena polymorpha]
MFYSNTYSIDELKAKCQKVCNEILKVEHVVNVYPTYTTNSTKRLVFVAVVENEFESTEQLKQLGYDIEIQYKQPKYTKDNPRQDDYLLKHEFTDKLKNVIRKFGNTLMLKHTNVSFIRGCKYRLVTENENEIKYEPRLAVYVRAKGFIPIGEEPIAKSYDGVPVDVREGVCITFAGGRANDILENVKMGCQIERHQSGSLGVLFENDNGLCGITCGHVVCSPKDMEQCMKKGGTVNFDTNYEVYQPKKPHTIGYLKKVIYKQGIGNDVGLDIGVIQLTSRPPIDGKFPIAEKAQSDLEFESGKAFEPKAVGEPCYKFGCVTEYTRSKITQTSEEPSVARFNFEGYTLILHNQILVKTNGVLFAEPGDSGSPVFIKACDELFFNTEQIIHDKEKQVERWVNHFSKFYS